MASSNGGGDVPYPKRTSSSAQKQMSSKSYHKTLLQERKYLNWVKGGLALKYLKDGIGDFVDEVVYDEHGRILQTLGLSPGSACNLCTLKRIKPPHAPSPTVKQCPIGQRNCNCLLSNTFSCPSNICDRIYDEIVKSHETLQPFWKNTDITKWTTHPWEIAKCFINVPGYDRKHSAEDTDVIGLLHLFVNCTFFQGRVSSSFNLFYKIREWRNSVFHSPSMELEDQQLIDGIYDIITLLEDEKVLKAKECSKKAVLNLKSLQQEHFIITTETEEEVCRAALASITLAINEVKYIQDEARKDIAFKIEEEKKYFDLKQEETIKNVRETAEYGSTKLQVELSELRKSVNNHDLEVNVLQTRVKAIEIDIVQLKQVQDHLTKHLREIEHISQTNLPLEIIRTDRRSIELYKQALAHGKVAIHNIRVMIVGYYGVGKTTLTKRLLGQDVEIGDQERTDGIKVHVNNCDVDIDTGNWVNRKKDDENESIYRRLARILKQINVEGEEEEEEEEEITSTHEAMAKPTPKNNITDKHSNMESAVFRAQKTNPSLTETVSSQSQPVTRPDKFNNAVSNDQARYFEDLAKELHKLPEEDNFSKADVSFWDFAGQYAFYDTHQVFLSRRTIYLLVIDISMSIDAIVQGDDCYPDSKGKSHWKVSDFVEFWLKSIHEFCYHSEEADSHLTTEHASGSSDHNRPPFGPPVILVGTFADKLNQSDRKETVHKYFSGLRQHLVEKNVFVANSHLIENNFDIDNTLTTETSNIELLKEQIIETAKQQRYWGEHVPTRWVTLEKVLVNLKSEGVKVLSKGQIVVLNSHLPVPIPNDEEIETFLKFHHECGHIIYYSKDEGLKQNIILDPQWLVDAFKCLITAEHFCCKSPLIHNEWIKFNKTAVCDRALIDKIWNSYEASDFKDHKDLLLNFLNRLGLIVQHSQKKDEFNLTDESMKGNTFLAPCILKDAPPQDVIENASYRKTTSKLCFTTRSGFLPTAVFNKLLAAFIQKYPITHYRTKQNKTQYHIYCGCGFFDVPNNHEMVLFFQDNMIQIWLSKYGDEEPDNKTCFEQCEFVMTFLTCHLTTLKISVKCLEASAYTSAGIFEMETLLKKEKVLCDCHYPRRHEVSTAQLTKYWCERSSPDATPNQNAKSMIQFPSGSNTGTLSQLGKSIPVTGAELTSYKMDRKPRGWCIIINNEKFGSIDERTGTQLDKDRLTRTFQRLHFIVESRDNLKSTEIIKYLNEVSRNYDHSSHDCFVCCILSHGKLGHVYGSDDSVVPIKDMTSEFNALRCPSLAGKPKLFFLQACQGSDLMPGVPAATDIQTDACGEETIPSEADFLLGYSTVPGYVSYRQTQSGTWYIRALCEALEVHWDRYSLLDILTEVNRKVAKESTAERGCVNKQIPAPQTTLTKRLYFR